jgi:hypothetical protein
MGFHTTLNTYVYGRLHAAIVGLNPTRGMDVCCVLSGRGLCDELITRPEKSYRLRRVVVLSRNLVKDATARAGLVSQRK